MIDLQYQLYAEYVTLFCKFAIYFNDKTQIHYQIIINIYMVELKVKATKLIHMSWEITSHDAFNYFTGLMDLF